MSGTFEYDVFLSHNQADKPRVRRLAERLRAAGLRVWFDERVTQMGDDIYLAMERRLKASCTIVLCLSLAVLGADWVRMALNIVLFLDSSDNSYLFIKSFLNFKLPIGQICYNLKEIDYAFTTSL